MCFKDEYKFRQSYISILEYIKEYWKKNECKSFSMRYLNSGCLSEIIFAMRKFNFM